MVFRLDIGLKFARSDFGEPGLVSRGEISASLNLEGKVAWVKDRFAKCEMRMESSSSSRVHTVDIDPQWHNMDCCI